MTNFKNSVRFFTVLAFASTLFCTPAYAQTRHAAEIARLAQAHAAGEVVIGKGDAVSLMAKSYSRANNVPFEVALKSLIDANPAAFADAQHNLIIGATFVLPAAQKEALPVQPVATPVFEAAAAPAVEAKIAEPVVVAPTPAVVKPEPAATVTYVEPWVWSLLAVFLLMILVRLFKRKLVQVADNIERHDNGAPKVVLGATEQTPEPTSELPAQVHANVEPMDEDDLPELDDDAPLNTPMPDARFNQALAGLSADSLDLTLLDNPAPPVVSQPPELPNNNVASQFFNYNFKTPMQQWREINVVKQAETTIHAKVEAMKVVQVAPEVLKTETAAAPTLNMDMPQFLNAFSHNLPEPTFTSVDYEDLLDKARLQAWLNIHTPEQILLFAQDAYDARYADVAQLMLNDVLLRGNAEQVSAVLNLRYLWSYPAGVY